MATRPQPAPAPLTSRQRTLTLSLCVLSNLPNIAAWSLSTVLFHAYFPSPKDAKSAGPSRDGGISHHASPQSWQAGTHRPPSRGACRSRSSFHCPGPLDKTWARMYLSGVREEESRGLGDWLDVGKKGVEVEGDTQVFDLK